MKITLCLNCLGRADGVRAVDIGPEKGTQRDPYRDAVDLCPICQTALLSGDFAKLAERNRTSTVIEVGEPTEPTEELDPLSYQQIIEDIEDGNLDTVTRILTALKDVTPENLCPHTDWDEVGYRMRQCNRCRLVVSM